MTEFRIFGPTCDSNDVLGAPFVLPENVREGDWIEVGMMGAYSLSMRTQFNGFFTDKIVHLTNN
jgi:ornithine decarboxylase